MLTPPWVKKSNLDSYKTDIHLCAEVPHELPKMEKAETYQSHSLAGNKTPRQTVGQCKRTTVA